MPPPGAPVYFQVQKPPQTPIPKRPQLPHNPKPKLRLRAEDVTHRAFATFFHSVDASSVLSDSVRTVLAILYPTHANWPPTRSVTLILEDMPGVAYTKGLALDDLHKEIHLSLSYVGQINRERLTHEILGVMVHEMVHCWQWNAQGTAPGGLIEGVADWVRLKAGLAPPHWKKTADGRWDKGYETTGYFLEYLERRFGDGTVVKLNDSLKEGKYDEEKFWGRLFGSDVEDLWKDYRKHLQAEEVKQPSNTDDKGE